MRLRRALRLTAQRHVARTCRRGAAVALFATVAWQASPSGAQTAPAEPARVEYTVAIDGVEDESLRDLLRATSLLERLKDNPPYTIAGLDRRIEEDRPNLDEALRSEGYYDARIEAQVERDKRPATVRLVVQPGPAYTLATYDVRYVGPNPAAGLPRTPQALGLTLGQRARAADVAAAETKLFATLANEAHPYAVRRDRRIVVDHDSDTMRATLDVDPGPAVRMPMPRFEGAPGVETAYLQRLVPWTAGEPFDRRKLDQLASRLRATGLFESARVDRGDAPAPDGTAPITVTLREAKPRSIGGGVSYSSSEGPAASAFWEHRNLFGRQERLGLEAQFGTLVQRLTGRFTKPNIGRYGQDLVASQVIDREDTDAFDGTLATTTVGVDRVIDRHLKVSAGGLFEYSALTDEFGESNYMLFGIPLALTFDSRDDILEPTRGARVRAEMTPFADVLLQDIYFLRNEVVASTYYAPFAGGGVVLAARARLGSIAGADTDQIPANRRFYAGGGGSLRGYGYQLAGPLRDDGKPRGGRSVVEVGAEARFRVFGDFGIVPFFEGGTVYDDAVPTFDGDLLWSAGLGFRYYSPIGPIRVDFAVPLDRRGGVDDSFQFYVSVGQAF